MQDTRQEKRQEDNNKTIIPAQWPHVTTVEKYFNFIKTAGTDQLQKCKHGDLGLPMTKILKPVAKSQ